MEIKVEESRWVEIATKKIQWEGIDKLQLKESGHGKQDESSNGTLDQ